MLEVFYFTPESKPEVAASLQLAGSIRNCLYIEYPCDLPSHSTDMWQTFLTEEKHIDQGAHLPVLPGAGIGI